MAKDGIFDQLYKGVADAVKDIREKAVEEAWYGKSLSGPETEAPHWPQAREPEQEASFGGIKRSIDMGTPTHDQMEGNANFRLAAMERELNAPHWPKATGHAQNIGQERDRDQDREMDR